MIDISKAVRIDIENREKAGPRKTYVLICNYKGCFLDIRVRHDAIKTHSGFCKSHSHVKRPFESIYNSLFHDWRKTKVELTYEEFLDFMKIDKCEYCRTHIKRNPFGTVNGVFKSRAHTLDKKDPNGSYSKNNCVVCCITCNKIKNCYLTYEEMKAAMKAVLKVRNNGS